MKDKIFGVLQRVGRSFMLPIALLPVAGLLLGIGSSFTNQTMLEAYGLTGVIYEGGIAYTVLDIMNQCGSAVFNNLALLFAMGVAIGMAKKEKEVAALSGAIAYIVCTAVFVVVGIAMFYVWPIVQMGIAALGDLVIRSGYAGTWIYGLLERALIPFGLHHVFYMPFWQTAVGGTAIVDGVTIQGAQNIFFAELASKSTQVFSVEATRFMAGKFPLMIFGLPGAALAMYRAAKPEKRKVAGGLLISAALTAMLTGITEPLEFTFLFVAPLMYAVHCVYAGLSYMLMHIFQVGVGMTFSGGVIDLTLFGILQGNTKTHWIWVVIVGAVYFVLYYFTFYFMITKMDLKTPGREDEGEETKLFTRSDFKAKTGVGPDGSAPSVSDPVSALILKGLGGKGNLSDVDCCATRLRVTVIDAEKVSDALLKQSGASGVIHKGNGVQVVYGPQVAVIKSNLVDFMETPEADRLDAVSAPAPASASPAKPAASKKKDAVLAAHMNGTVVPMAEVQDEAFSNCILGDGVAIEPSEGKLYAPADAEVDNLFDTHHAIGLVTEDGVEILLHIGINTVELGGKHFEAHVEAGQTVKQGDLLISFDIEAVKAAGYLCTTPMIVCNTEDYQSVTPTAEGEIQAGAGLLEIKG